LDNPDLIFVTGLVKESEAQMWESKRRLYENLDKLNLKNVANYS